MSPVPKSPWLSSRYCWQQVELPCLVASKILMRLELASFKQFSASFSELYNLASSPRNAKRPHRRLLACAGVAKIGYTSVDSLRESATLHFKLAINSKILWKIVSFAWSWEVWMYMQSLCLVINPGQIMQNIHKEMMDHNFHGHQSASGLFERSS